MDERVVRELCKRVRPSSHQTYRGCIDNYIVPNIGAIPLEKLTSLDLQKLYKKKVGDSSASMPTAPTEPADGNEETASKDYADYIINLAGDEWDSEKGAWKDADSTYAKAFADDAFTADSATYKQAMTAYYTAYQHYSSQASSASSKWTEYANGLYAKANISIYGLFALRA